MKAALVALAGLMEGHREHTQSLFFEPQGKSLETPSWVHSWLDLSHDHGYHLCLSSPAGFRSCGSEPLEPELELARDM